FTAVLGGPVPVPLAPEPVQPVQDVQPPVEPGRRAGGRAETTSAVHVCQPNPAARRGNRPRTDSRRILRIRSPPLRTARPTGIPTAARGSAGGRRPVTGPGQDGRSSRTPARESEPLSRAADRSPRRRARAPAGPAAGPAGGRRAPAGDRRTARGRGAPGR